MAIVIKNNRYYVECIRKSKTLSDIVMRLEWYMDSCECISEDMAEDELEKAKTSINRCIKAIDEYRTTLVEKVECSSCVRTPEGT